MNNHKNLESLLFTMFAIALTAVAGSLYFSEILEFIPCKLCWVQRIFMYPLALILAIAIIRKDTSVIYYVLPLSLIGTGIAFYHYLIQKVEIFSSQGGSCTLVPCNSEYINWLGFITIPLLSLIAFISISIISLSLLKIIRSK